MVETGGTLGPWYLGTRLLHCEGHEYFLALSLSDGEEALLQVCDLDWPQRRDRLQHEADLLSTLAGAGCVQLVGYDQDETIGKGWLALRPAALPVMNLIGARVDPLREADALVLTRAIARALEPLHQRELIHGDVSLENTLIDEHGAAHLIGLSLAGPPAGAFERGLGALAGLAPEVMSGNGHGPRAEVFALGVILHRLRTREAPFGFGPRPDLEQRMRDGFEPGAAWSPVGQRVLSRLLAHEPAQRAANAIEAGTLLDGALAELGIDQTAARASLGREAGRLFAAFARPLPADRRDLDGSLEEEDTEEVAQRTRELQLDIGSLPGAGMPPPPLPEDSDTGRQALSPPDGAATPPAPAPASAPHPTTPTDPAPIPAASPAAPPVAASRGGLLRAKRSRATTAEPTQERRGAARWYERMNPFVTFPLDVVVASGRIRLPAAEGMSTTEAKGTFEIDPQDPWVDVVPEFPGCLVVPQSVRIDARRTRAHAAFWVTPLASGKMPEACVRLRHKDRIVQTLSTPFRVVSRTWARLLALSGALSPLVVQILDGFGWSLSGEVQSGFPLLAQIAASLGVFGVTALLVILLGALAFVAWRLTRPLARGPSLGEEP